MQTVKVTFSVTVIPAQTEPNPLVITPAGGSLSQETVGVDIGKVTIGKISGGTPPYAVAFSPGSAAPAGQVLDLENGTDIVLSGAPTAAGDTSFELTVTDSGV